MINEAIVINNADALLEKIRLWVLSGEYGSRLESKK